MNLGLDPNDDNLWRSLTGGYRIPYDPRPALRSLELGDNVEASWRELSTELYHQGDVGEASYAAVPHLVRIHEQRGIPDRNTYALAAMIEEGRNAPQNPIVPDHLRDAYEQAWGDLVRIGLKELEVANEPLLKRLKLCTRITSNAGDLVVAASIMRWNSGRRSSVADAPGST
jgi:hypothetical protein